MPPIPARLGQLALDMLLLIAIGGLMAYLGPYGSNANLGPLAAWIYWIAMIVGGGVIGLVLDAAWGRRLANPWLRWVGVSLVMTPFVTAFVGVTTRLAFDAPLDLHRWLILTPQVMVICFLVMGVRQLMWAGRKAPVLVGPPVKARSDEAFRKRLSARRREAVLIAVEAEDHYLRVHTDAGSELITLRFADALAELDGVPGFQTHRSWWVAADAIQKVRWRRGRGELAAAGDLAVPVSRTFAAALKEAGWF